MIIKDPGGQRSFKQNSVIASYLKKMLFFCAFSLSMSLNDKHQVNENHEKKGS